MLFAAFGFSASAQSYGTIVGENVEVERGETFTVKFSYESNPGFWILFMTLHFDSQSLELVQTKKGTYKNASLNQMTYPDDAGKVLLDIEGTQANDVTGDGVLAEVTFRVKDDAKIQNNAIVISVGDGKACNFNTELIKPAVKYALVNVVCKEHDMENGSCKICGYSDGTAKEPEIVLPVPEKTEDKQEIQQTVTNTQNAGGEVVSGNTVQNQENNPAPQKVNEKGPKINVYALVGALTVLLAGVLVIIIYIFNKK